MKAREAILRLTSATGRELLAPAAVPKLTRTPAATPRRAPALGEHTDAVRSAIERIEARARVDASDRGGRRDAAWGPLRGVRVLDLSQWLAGPAAAALLGDFGADVIMVELPSVAADAQGRKSPGLRGHQPQQAQHHARRARPRRPRGVPRPGARERRDRGELPARHARALGPGAGHAPGGQPAARAPALLRLRADRAVHGARRVQPGRPGLRRDHLPERLAGPAAAPRRGHGRRLLDGARSTCWAWWPRCCGATSTARGRWWTPPCSRPRCG